MRERLLFQSSPCCGEDTYILRIYIRVPPHGVTGVGEGRALGLPGPVSLPLPDDKGTDKEKMKFKTLKR